MKSDLHWGKIGLFSHHGICLPLSALRSKNSAGIGEFLDLIPLIDWCKKIQFDCIQLLPLNDSGLDASPYNAVSSCALDPVYLSFSQLGLSHEPFAFLTEKPRLNRLAVLSLKMELLRPFFKQTFSALSKTDSYRSFVEENEWLKDYTLFKSKSEKEEPDFYCFLQFHCFNQMKQVRAHASAQGVFLKGDIPILLSPQSADVSAHPELFCLDLDAGAPPDYYNPKGQKWGFPLFNWEAMQKDQFRWWKQRLKTAEQLFHIYRIDHVVGLFRMWGIPKGKKASEGSFFPASPAVWFAQGKEHLEMFLNATSLLPIAEDLGTIPKEVYPILKELGICGTKVVRWQRHWETDKSYIPFDQYEPLSMTTLSTHDMEPLDLWWKKHPDESVPFSAFMKWPYHPILTQNQRLQILKEAHHSSSFFHINLLQEYLALQPELVWPNPEEERINIPGTFLPTNWTYRFRPFLEEIISNPQLQAHFIKILS